MTEEKRGIEHLKKLNNKHLEYCRLYVASGRGGESAAGAGFAKNSAHVRSSTFMKDPLILEEIARLRKARSDELGLNANDLLLDLKAMREFHITEILDEEGGFKPIHQWPSIAQKMVNSYEIIPLYEYKSVEGKNKRVKVGVKQRVKMVSREHIMRMYGQHTDISAFNEMIVGVETKQTYAELLAERKKRSAKQKSIH